MSQPILISDYVFPLDKFGKVGKIHSRFEHSFNIEVSGQLINVANYREYLSCYGIFLPDNLFEKQLKNYQQGDVVRLQEDGFAIYSRQGVAKIVLADYQLVSLQISQANLQQATLLALKTILEEKQLSQLLGLDYQTIPVDLLPQLTGELPLTNWQPIIEWLIGRGKGLTPSGDDLLTGYLFLLKIAGLPDVADLQQALVASKLPTTDISKNYLEVLMKGYVSSPFYQLYQDLLQASSADILAQDVAAIMKIGHTSGKDLSFGILLGILFVLKQRHG
ncbi:oxamate carbamoyltransferase subunit AllH family protein [Enterococcus sp. LJL120]